MSVRLGAYILPGDPVWLLETLQRYYPLLDDLVVPVPTGSMGWNGTIIPVEQCLQIIRSIDSRGIAREIEGTWVNTDNPMLAETEQRRSALRALDGTVDWVLQLDSDEYLPRPELIREAIAIADAHEAVAVEIPMRVLFRRTRRHVFEVAGPGGSVHHEYPGPVLVRPDVQLVNARQSAGRSVRLASASAASSMQVRSAPGEQEIRVEGFADEDAIVHNSWARSPEEIRRKIGSWGHAKDAHFGPYYWLRWWPVPLTWWAQWDFHPFQRGLWPRLRRLPNEGEVADTPVPRAGR